ncbi:GNAT family N-acetyltransferase [Arcticibacter sp. MXS-1]|uniref:GNAT family N-acetyltransferase n=1 Tax=Arcticibacter sp. MXS-1 TaxID=3341726 RepID=UPI0035A97984
MDFTNIPLNNNEDQQQYELVIEGERSFVEYEIRDNVIYLTHTEVPEELEGRGVASAMVEMIMQDIEKRGLQLVPYCSYVRVFLKRHPEWNRLLKNSE